MKCKISEYLAGLSDKRILDLGCNTDKTLFELCSLKNEIISLDMDLEALAKRKTLDYKTAATAYSLPFRDSALDMVYISNVPFVDEISFAEINRATKSQGELLWKSYRFMINGEFPEGFALINNKAQKVSESLAFKKLISAAGYKIKGILGDDGILVSKEINILLSDEDHARWCQCSFFPDPYNVIEGARNRVVLKIEDSIAAQQWLEEKGFLDFAMNHKYLDKLNGNVHIGLPDKAFVFFRNFDK
ncbi:MAG: methyltransferase domain-containing protein [Nanoarchaeota archaeon]|nr:methyltransferase domain-containing protein [Nanoarchaeota archaeon]